MPADAAAPGPISPQAAGALAEDSEAEEASAGAAVLADSVAEASVAAAPEDPGSAGISESQKVRKSEGQ